MSCLGLTLNASRNSTSALCLLHHYYAPLSCHNTKCTASLHNPCMSNIIWLNVNNETQVQAMKLFKVSQQHKSSFEFKVWKISLTNASLNMWIQVLKSSIFLIYLLHESVIMSYRHINGLQSAYKELKVKGYKLATCRLHHTR